MIDIRGFVVDIAMVMAAVGIVSMSMLLSVLFQPNIDMDAMATATSMRLVYIYKCCCVVPRVA